MQKHLAAARGLDVGTSRIVVAEPNGGEFEYRAQLNAFVALPDSKITETMLRKEGVPFQAVRTQILVMGERAEKFAQVFCGDTRRPMHNGLLNPAERHGLAVMEDLIGRLCGPPREGERLCFSVPSPAPGGEGDVAYHEAALAEMLTRLGFRPKSVNEGLAVVFAELEAANFTGLGISFGGGLCNACLAYLGVPVLSFSTAKGGDFIDRSAASVTGESPAAVRLFKEQSLCLNGRRESRLEQALTVYYDDMIQTLVSRLEQELAASRAVPKLEKAVPIVASGGSVRVEGFLPRLEKAIRAAALPIPIGEIRLAGDPLNTTARGTLVAALLEA